jgi:hypothetical protein
VQSFPQVPQLRTSVATLTHRSPQEVKGGVQEATHPVGEQSGVAGAHCVSQALHVVGVDRSASHPSRGSRLQSAQPGIHVSTAQAPLAHFAVARSKWQGVQLPELQPCLGSPTEMQCPPHTH